MQNFTEPLKKVYTFAQTLGLNVIDTSDLDTYFKGDLNGIDIWISSTLDDEEELFNLLHLIGHSIQWNLSKELRELGSVLHESPDDTLLRRLQEYEWEANCYALTVLDKVNELTLSEWLSEKYRFDMFYLTHYYKTGEKLKEITDIAKAYEFTWPLVVKGIPPFVPYANRESRRGIVIDFAA